MAPDPSCYAVKSTPTVFDHARNLAQALESADQPRADAVALSEHSQNEALWVVEAYYSTRPDQQALAGILAVAGMPASSVCIEPVSARDWVRESLDALKPVRAGRFFVHAGHHREHCPAGATILEIPAACAFGTGHHATTRGCLLALDQIAKHGPARCVLDVGCGSGILALAAARGMRARAVACDIDPEAVRAARANAALNGAASHVRAVLADGARHGTIRAFAPYDLVLANILARPLCALAGDLAAVVTRGGRLVLSGLLTCQEAQVLAAYRTRGAVLERCIRLEGWSTLVIKRSAAR